MVIDLNERRKAKLEASQAKEQPKAEVETKPMSESELIEIQERNKRNKERETKQRKKDNRQVTESYGLKTERNRNE